MADGNKGDHLLPGTFTPEQLVSFVERGVSGIVAADEDKDKVLQQEELPSAIRSLPEASAASFGAEQAAQLRHFLQGQCNILPAMTLEAKEALSADLQQGMAEALQGVRDFPRPAEAATQQGERAAESPAIFLLPPEQRDAMIQAQKELGFALGTAMHTPAVAAAREALPVRLEKNITADIFCEAGGFKPAPMPFTASTEFDKGR